MRQHLKELNVPGSKNSLARLIILLFAIATAGSLHAEGSPPLTHQLTAIKAGTQAPPLKLKNLDGDNVSLEDLRGKVVVVNFWATWCPPCRREMGSLERLYQATKDRNIEVVAVNIGEDEDTVFSFMGMVEPSPSFTMLLDNDAVSMSSWKVRGLPTTYFVKPNGELAYRAVGGREFDHPDIQDKVIKLSK